MSIVLDWLPVLLSALMIYGFIVDPVLMLLLAVAGWFVFLFCAFFGLHPGQWLSNWLVRLFS